MSWLVGEAAACKSVQASHVVTDGVSRELSSSASRRSVVGRRYSAVCCRILRRNNTRLGKATNIRGMSPLTCFDGVLSSDVNKANSVKAKAKAKARSLQGQGQGQGLTLQKIKSRS